MQSSFAVGDAILPGVVLKAVAFDHVSIDRGGAEEQIFIDQSDSASREGDPSPSEGEGFAPAEVVSAAGRDNPTAESLRRDIGRSEDHTSELQSLMRISYAVFCLKKKNKHLEYTRQLTPLQI